MPKRKFNMMSKENEDTDMIIVLIDLSVIV